MLADMHRLENAARLAMGDVTAPTLAQRARRPAFNLSSRPLQALLAVAGVLIALALLF